jgi:hypothetical protein
MCLSGQFEFEDADVISLPLYRNSRLTWTIENQNLLMEMAIDAKPKLTCWRVDDVLMGNFFLLCLCRELSFDKRHY